MSYDFFSNSSPAEIIIAIAISLALTLVTYCAIPLLMAYLRKKPIDKKIFWRNCMLANIPVAIIWSIIGESASVGPYIIWSNVFSSVGCKVLKKRGLLVDKSAPAAPKKSSDYTLVGESDADTAAFNSGKYFKCSQCGAYHSVVDKKCSSCGGKNTVLAIKMRQVRKPAPADTYYTDNYSPDAYAAYSANSSDYAMKDSSAVPTPSASAAAAPAAGKGPAKFCGQCGTKLKPTDKFCSGCGAALK